MLAFAGFSLFLLTQILGLHSSMNLEGIPGIGEDERVCHTFTIVIAHILVFITASILWRKRVSAPFARPRLFASVTTLIGCAGFALLWLSPRLIRVASAAPVDSNTLMSSTLSASAFMLGTGLIGAMMAFCSLYWLQRLTLFSYRGSYFYLLCGHAVATCLCAVVLLALPGLGAAITPVCFVLSNFCLAASALPSPFPAGLPHVAATVSRPSASLASQSRDIATLLWRGVLSVCIFALISGLVSRLSGQTTTDPGGLQGYMLATSACVLVIMLIPAALTNKPLKLENSYLIALPLSALSFLVVPSLISSLPAETNGILVATGYMLVGIILYCTIAEISRFTAIPAAPLLAICGSLTLGCYLLGFLLARPIILHLPENLTGPLVIGLGLLYLIVLGAVSLFERSAFLPYDHPTQSIATLGARDGESPDMLPSGSAAGSAVGSAVGSALGLALTPDDRDTFLGQNSSVNQLANNHGLSGREREILPLLARGRTLPRIGEDLYLSTSAVKYHTRAIYRKLGIHSRKELPLALRAVGGPDNNPRPAGYLALTVRERQVFGLLASGGSVEAIAESLDVSQNTAKTHIKRVYQKLGVHSKQELIDLLDEAFET
jgi:DNA-binding NarL/FixJ family response regulator